MNIFSSNTDPVKAAQALDDKRVIKMCLESAQLLSAALWLNGVWRDSVYKPTHAQHPCTLWTAESRNNFIWLVHHGLALSKEYQYRFDKRTGHGAAVIISNAKRILDENKEVFTKTKMTPFANCTPYKDEPDTVLAYQRYLCDNKWGPLTNWTKRGKPDFWREPNVL